MRHFYCTLAGAGAMLLAGLSPVQAATEIQFWHAMGGVLGERVEEIVKRFNDSQSKYTVVADQQGQLRRGHQRHHRRLSRQEAAADRADLRARLHDHAAVRRHRAGAGPADGEEAADRLADFIKPVASYYQYKGKLMSMPFNSSTPILFYNKEHFEKAGFDEPGRDLAGAREAALRHQEQGRRRNAARRSPATTSGA